MREALRSRCRRRLELLADSTLDVDTLRIEAVEELRRAIGFALWGVPLVDPDTLIPYRPAVSDLPPWGPRLPQRWILDQSLREINSRAALARGPDPVGVLSSATGGDLARCLRWRELGRPVGMGDELRAAIVDEQGCWGSFELFRGADDPPFDEDDAGLMRDAARILAPAVRRGRVAWTEGGQVVPGQTGVVVVGDDLRAQGVTPAARAWFSLLGARQQSERTPLPLAVYGVVGRLLAAEAGEDPDRPPWVRVRTVGGHWAIVEAARLDGGGGAVAVSIRSAAPGDVLSLIGRAYRLTARERQLVVFVLEGLDTRQLAARMVISPHTIKDHLKSVFEKLEVHSRRELVTGVFGQTV